MGNPKSKLIFQPSFFRGELLNLGSFKTPGFGDRNCAKLNWNFRSSLRVVSHKGFTQNTANLPIHWNCRVNRSPGESALPTSMMRSRKLWVAGIERSKSKPQPNTQSNLSTVNSPGSRFERFEREDSKKKLVIFLKFVWWFFHWFCRPFLNAADLLWTCVYIIYSIIVLVL